jgi:hypothetical protein
VIHYPFEAEEREREMGTIDEEEIQRWNQGVKWETLYFPRGEKELHFVGRFPGYASSSF